MLTVTPVSRKLWQRESLGGVGQKEGEEEEGKGVSVTGEIGEKAEEEEEEERKEEEGEIRKIVSEDSVDTAGAVEEVEKKPDLVESKEEEVSWLTVKPFVNRSKMELFCVSVLFPRLIYYSEWPCG